MIPNRSPVTNPNNFNAFFIVRSRAFHSADCHRLARSTCIHRAQAWLHPGARCGCQHPCGQSDEAQLKKLLEDHNRWTGSKRARELLDHWAASRSKFVKVFPTEYKRALSEMYERQVLEDSSTPPVAGPELTAVAAK